MEKEVRQHRKVSGNRHTTASPASRRPASPDGEEEARAPAPSRRNSQTLGPESTGTLLLCHWISAHYGLIKTMESSHPS